MKWNREHRALVNARIKEVKAKNPEKYKAIDKAYREEHAEKINERRDAYRRENPEKEKEWREKYRKSPKGRACGKRQYHKLRMAVLQAYGGLIPHCACCGEGHEEFLTIDHIDGKGADHRREGKRGMNLLYWLIKNDFPKGFRVLCMNCNLSLGMRGYCPHRGHPVVSEL